MTVKEENVFSVTEAKTDLSKVTDAVDENGFTVITKCSVPKYFVLPFDEFEGIIVSELDRRAKIAEIYKKITEENGDLLQRLAEDD